MRLGSGFVGRGDLLGAWRPLGRPGCWVLCEYPLLRVLPLTVSLLQRVPLANAPKEPKVCALTFGPLAKARGSFAPVSIRAHRLRFASLHLLSMCSTSSNGAARLPPDEHLRSACRRGKRSKAKTRSKARSRAPHPSPLPEGEGTDRGVWQSYADLGYCSGLMKPDTHLGENARQIEVSDDQATSFLFR